MNSWLGQYKIPFKLIKSIEMESATKLNPGPIKVESRELGYMSLNKNVKRSKWL